MNKHSPLSHFPIIVFAVLAATAFFGCAGYEAQNKENLFSAAGFRTETPTTAAQQAMFNRMTPYKPERWVRNGKVLYAFADKSRNVVYIGGEAEFQRYKQLRLQRSTEEQYLREHYFVP